VKLLDEHTKTLTSDVQALQGRVAANEAQIATAGDERGRAATLTLLAGQVEAAVDQAGGYEAPLESLRALGADDPAVNEVVAQLAPAAASGVPSLAALRQSFETTASRIVHAGPAPGGEGVLERAADSLMRLVTVRPVGADVEGDGAPARVARAEAKLTAGDLAGAVAELEGLEGPEAEAAAPWLAQAKARLAVESALDRLRTHTTGLLAQAQ
jgi:hypothetical protein